MALALTAVGVIALLIGLKFRVPALITATLVVIIASVVTCTLLDVATYQTIKSTLYLVLIMQGAYLAGLGMATLWHRVIMNR